MENYYISIIEIIYNSANIFYPLHSSVSISILFIYTIYKGNTPIQHFWVGFFLPTMPSIFDKCNK